jgi:hypothetical protein
MKATEVCTIAENAFGKSKYSSGVNPCFVIILIAGNVGSEPRKYRIDVGPTDLNVGLLWLQMLTLLVCLLFYFLT